MAYRGSRLAETPKRAAQQGGIIDDMVRQFADRYAFMRELVQNGIDAGATRVEIRIERDLSSTIVTSVDDDGSGMTREIIEGPLLTLFSSSKEDDSSKIGKYGIGFVSVFAIEPSVVEVRTRGAKDNQAWLVRLFGDHSFELLDVSQEALSPRSPRSKTGTTVSLIQNNAPAPAADGPPFEAHAINATQALKKWCRHAHVPIRLSILDAFDPASARTIDINEPMATPGLVSVSASMDGESFVVSVGAAIEETTTSTTTASSQPTLSSASFLSPAPNTSFGGFYNRGLTLYESTEPEKNLEGIRFKIDSPRLSHTLSRDNVKRDKEHQRVIDEVVALVRRGLRREVAARLQRAAVPKSGSAGGWSTQQEEEYRRLLQAASARAFSFSKDKQIVLPLLEPIGSDDESRRPPEDRWTIPLYDVEPGPSGHILTAARSTPLTRALAREGHAVVRTVGQLALLRRFLGKAGVLDASQALSYAYAIRPEDAQPNDAAFLEALAVVLTRAGRRVAQARIAVFEGMSSTDAVRVIDRKAEDAITFLEPDGKTFPPKYVRENRWGRSATIFLNAEDAGVRLARRRAKSDVMAAAHLFCRAMILLAEGPLEAKIVDRLLEAASDN